MSARFPFFKCPRSETAAANGKLHQEKTKQKWKQNLFPCRRRTCSCAVMQTHRGTDMDGHKSRCPHTHTHWPTCAHVHGRVLHTLRPHEQTNSPPNTDASRRGCKHIWRSVSPKTKGGKTKRTSVINVQSGRRLVESSAAFEFRHSCAAHLCNQLRISITEQGQEAFQVDDILIDNNNSQTSMKKQRLTDTRRGNRNPKKEREEDVSHGDEIMTLHLLSLSDGGTERIRLLMTFRRIIV